MGWGGGRSEQSPALLLSQPLLTLRSSSTEFDWDGDGNAGKMYRCGPWGHGALVAVAVLGERLDSMISESFSNLNASMILWNSPEPRLWVLCRCFPAAAFPTPLAEEEQEVFHVTRADPGERSLS